MSKTGIGTSGLGSDDIRRPLDMDELDSEASEFSWGPGLTPKALKDAPPSHGGRYCGTTPEIPPQINVSR